MKVLCKILAAIAVLAILPPANSIVAQKKHLSVGDYDQWQRLSTTVISNDGAWFAYNIGLVEGDGWLTLKNIASGKEDTFKVSSRPAFSNNNKWFVFNIDLPEKTRKKMEKSKKPIRNKIGLMNLASGKIDTMEGVMQVTFSDDGKFIAMKKYKVEGKKSAGSDVVLRNLETGVDRLIGNVAGHSFNEDGSMLAVVIDAEEKFGNGVHLWDLKTGILKVLDSHKAVYKSLMWNEEGNALAFLRSEENKDYEKDTHLVFAFHETNKTNPAKSIYDPGKDPNFTEGYRIVSERKLRWSDDSKSLFFGVNEWKKKEDKEDKEDLEEEKSEEGEEDEKKAKPKKDKDADLPPAGVDVWHWKDEPVQPRQAKTAEQDRNFSYLAAWHLKENKFVQLARDDMKSVTLTGDQKHGIGYESKPYEPIFEDSWNDIYIIDAKTGEREPVMKKFLRMSASPGGKYLAYFKDNEWWTYNIAKKTHANITENIDSRFENYSRVNGRSALSAWGGGIWFKDDKAVLIYDRYDVYKITPDGKKSERLTDGAKERVRFRLTRVDTEESYLKPDENLYFSAYGDFTKDSGYYIMKKGKKPEKLIYEPCSIGRLSKAEDADLFLFRRSKEDMSPNIFLAGADLKNGKQLTDTNPQQKDFYWGRSELITFKNKNGVELQGKLLYPENYEAGKKYPMVVYIYEMRSQSLHSYTAPSRTRAYNQRRFSADGFFVYEPDIVYRINDPGVSAVECVVPAVEEVLKTGKIDRDKIGLMGHSWGAYQTCFIVTQTDMFNAAVAGAPLINMVSMSLSIYANSGTPNLNIFEISQGRLDEPFWKIPEKYIENSPLYQSENINTPLMIAFGDKDGAVNWNQGVEMYTAMRRREKPFVMLVYAGENHGLAKKENQIDYATRTHEWMKHYLLGGEPADWVVKGIPFIDKKTKK